jgi:hypothetical protein
MANPFTKFLNQWSDDTAFTDFVVHWDSLEQLTVRVYRQKLNPAQVAQEFHRVWSWLRANYSRWEMVLRPYWQHTKVGGVTTSNDPFLMLLALQKPSDIQENWHAMQHLPAAREALNQYLTDSNAPNS